MTGKDIDPFERPAGSGAGHAAIDAQARLHHAYLLACS